MTRALVTVGAVALGLMLIGCESHKTAQTYQDRGEVAAGMNTADHSFVMDAAAGGAFEIQASHLALQKSNDAHVKAMAQKLIDDHTRANNQLTEIARRRGQTVTGNLTADQQQMITRLQGLQGTDFDKEFLRQQEQAHRGAIAAFQKEARDGQDADMKSFASQTLPTLQGHLNMLTGQSNGTNMGMER